MTFRVGNPGKPKGALNRRTREAVARLEAAGFCPITALIDGHKIAMEQFIEELDMVRSNRRSPMECAAPQYLKMALDCSKDLMAYAYPKLKAVESSSPGSALDHMTDEQQLEAMKLAVAHKEQQIKAQKVGDG